MIKEYIKGSILDAPQKHIAHGVNCQNKMGSGVAKALFTKYPDVKKFYHLFIEANLTTIAERSKLLGKVQILIMPDEKRVVNCFTQEFYGYDGKKYVNYDAIHSCFEALRKTNIKEIAIPKIGCGLAGGNWEVVSRIIDDATGDDLDVYVYYLE